MPLAQINMTAGQHATIKRAAKIARLTMRDFLPIASAAYAAQVIKAEKERGQNSRDPQR